MQAVYPNFIRGVCLLRRLGIIDVKMLLIDCESFLV
jgi:hypothetical protein